MKTIHAADLFCGAGGTTSGIHQACQALGYNLNLTAVNHWPIAIETHRANFPDVQHYCASLADVDLSNAGGLNLAIDSLDPRKAVPRGKLDLLVASPECMHHSNARGSMPVNDQSRATAWCVLRWADALRPRHILIENVPEFRTWGPLGANNRPLKSRKGEIYQAFLQSLKALGYKVDDRILCSADYGDPTTRKRLFVLARRGNRNVKWPEPTHAKPDENGKVPDGKIPWVPAREIIDWEIHGKSIFGRKKPLSEKTIERIAMGIKKFWGPYAEPFLVMLYGTNDARSMERPLPTVTSGGQHIGVARPFLVQYHGGEGAEERTYDPDNPLPTQDCSNRYALCRPFILPHRQFENMTVDDVDDPLRTVVSSNGQGMLVEPFIVGTGGPSGSAKPRGTDDPLKTVLTENRFGVVSPFIVKYYGTGRAKDVEGPLDAVTTKDRFALVEGTYRLDILFRMLQPHELAAAMGFPEGYHFAGNKSDKVRQIGGAVSVNLAKSLGMAVLTA